MRAAQLDGSKVVINYAEVLEFDGVQFVDPTGSSLGDVWNGTSFTAGVAAPPTLAEIEVAIQQQMDQYAQSWGYDDCKTACTYVGSTISKFNAEGVALRDWRDAVWDAASTIADEIAAGTTQRPASIAAAIAMMPAFPARPT